jgi:hypothetical protein
VCVVGWVFLCGGLGGVLVFLGRRRRGSPPTRSAKLNKPTHTPLLPPPPPPLHYSTLLRTDRLAALVARQARVDHAVRDGVAAHVERAPLLGDRLGQADLVFLFFVFWCLCGSVFVFLCMCGGSQ